MVGSMWVLCALTAAFAATLWSLWSKSSREIFDSLRINESEIGGHVMRISENLHIDFRSEIENRVVLSGSLGMNLSKGRIFCTNIKEFLNVSCLWDDKGNRVEISLLPTLPRIKCTNFVWVAVSYNDILKDCFRLFDAHWYGGGVHFDQSWPIEKVVRRETPFVTGDLLQKTHGHYGGVGERFWFSSKGVAIVVNPNVPLFVSLNQSNDGRLCLVGKNGFPYRNTKRAPPSLDYTVCVANNILSVYKDVYKLFYRFPVNIPDEQLFLNPIWSTWANFHSDVNQTKVEQLALEIEKYEFPRGILSIDDRWEYCYGDMVFDSEKFPNPKEMMTKLKMQGFLVTLWIHPFSNDECTTFKEGLRLNYWVTGRNVSQVGLVSWWNGHAGLVDVTNEDAMSWWIGRVSKLQSDYDVYSFKFDAGETTWLPIDTKLSTTDDVYPNVYSTKYVEAVAANFGRSIEVRIGYRTQHLPVFVRMMDKHSVWNESNGLKTIIPTALHFGLMGYPFILPDMVGGNGYEPHFPSRELLIRWLQLSIFLPAIQLSIVPWSNHFDERVIYMWKKALKIRARFAPLMVSLARESSRSGSPIVRPLWWISPTDSNTYDIDSQFLVGDSLLVAPILDPGATRRDIYLPKGIWLDELADVVHHGPQWLRNYKVQLSEIAFFIRIPKSNMNSGNRL